MAINVNVGGNTGPLERDVRAAMDRINRAGGLKIRVDDKGVTQPLGNMKRSADEFSKSLEASNARVLAFGASVGIINAVSNAFKGLVEQTIKVEKNLTDINVVMGLTSKQLDKFGGGLFKVAAETGAGFQAASEAATEFARQGLGVAETLKRTKDALVLTRLTGMKATESVKSLTAAMNTFKGEVHDSTVLVSKFAAVDVKFAVSAEDFAQAIARAGASARDAGVDINELIGIVTAVQERTARGGAVIGNAFKTIFTRLRRGSTLQQLEDIGIAVRDLKGSTLPAMKILQQLANRYDTLTDAQRSYISQNVAGVFQINMLKAAMADLGKTNSVTSQATKIASQATDESSRKNEQLRQTMSALATESGVAIQELAKKIGDIALAPGINKILDGVKGVADWANNLLGDGEQEGNRFAKGLLAGVGNFLSGPGLVVITAVVSKLFVNAAKYGVQSLQSLLGMNKLASSRKHTEQAILQVMASNAALAKEMLRTDISREKKEQMILALIRQQTTEAQKLAAVSKQLTLPMIRAGVTPNLSMRRGNASGFIPNYAAEKSERQLAQQAGYSPGAVKQMNIPGVGDITYNTAESVKKFPGMTQPAIIPPVNSKAAGAYDATFTEAHGFSPYAAKGHIPNYANLALNLKNVQKQAGSAGAGTFVKGRTSGSMRINLNKVFAEKIDGLGVLAGTGPESLQPVKYSQSLDSVPALRNRVLQVAKAKNIDASHAVKTMGVESTLASKGVYPITAGDVDKASGGASSWESALNSTSGLSTAMDNLGGVISKKLFKGKGPAIKPGNALKHAMEEKSWQGYMLESGVKSALRRDIDRGKEGQRAFDLDGNITEPMREFMDGKKFDALELKNTLSTDVRGKSGNVSNKVFTKLSKVLGDAKLTAAITPILNTLGTKAYSKKKARGFIPNYADPLSDAIGREQGAGVPVSKIRVGSHRALRAASNPGGLGVTNTSDEPRGLKDVFGAGGFVPNYADPPPLRRVSTQGGYPLIDSNQKKLVAQEVQRLTKEYQKGRLTLGDVNNKLKSMGANVSGLGTGFNLTKSAVAQLNTQIKTAGSKLGAVGNFNAGMGGTAGGGAMGALGRFQGGHNFAGKSMNGMGGMGAMMALSMGAGFVDTEGENAKSFGNQAASGAMTGASTGMAIGMMAGPLGMAAGAAAGGLYGVLTASGKVAEAKAKEKKAIEESNAAIRKNINAFNDNSVAQATAMAFAENQIFKTLPSTSSDKFVKLLQRDDYTGNLLSQQGKSESDIFKGRSPLKSIKDLYNIADGDGAATETGKSILKSDPNTFAGKEVVASFDKQMAKGKWNLEIPDSAKDNTDKEFLKNVKLMQQNMSFGFKKYEGGVLQSTKRRVSTQEGLSPEQNLKSDLKMLIGLTAQPGGGSNTLHQATYSATKAHKSYQEGREGLLDGSFSIKDSANDYLDQIIGNAFSSATESKKIHNMEVQVSKMGSDGNAIKGGVLKNKELSGKDISTLMRGGFGDENGSAMTTARRIGLVDGKDSPSDGTARIEKFREDRRKQLRAQLQQNDKLLNQEKKQLNFLRIKAISDAKFQAAGNQIRQSLMQENKGANSALKLYNKSLTASARGQIKHNMEVNKVNSKHRQAQLAATKSMKDAFIQKSQDSSTGLGQEIKNLFNNEANNGALKSVLGEGKFAGFQAIAENDIDQAIAGLSAEDFGKILDKLNAQILGNANLKRFYDAQLKIKEGLNQKAKDENNLSIRKLDNERDINEVLESRADILQTLKSLQDSRDVGKGFADKYSSLTLENQSLKGQTALARVGGGTVAQQYNFSRNKAISKNSVDRTLTREDRENTARKKIQDIMKDTGFYETVGSEDLHNTPAKDLLKQAQGYYSTDTIDSRIEAEEVSGNGEVGKISALQAHKELISNGYSTAQMDQLANVQKMIEGNEKLLEQEDQRFKSMQELVKIQHEFVYGGDAFSNGMQKAFKDASDSAAKFKYDIGEALPKAFASNMSQAIMQVTREGGSVGDALRGAAIGFLDTMNQMFVENMMNNMMAGMYDNGDTEAQQSINATQTLNNTNFKLTGSIDALAGRISDLAGAIRSMPAPSSPAKQFRGGPVGLNKGGKVPSMLTNGEFVMGRDAVSRFGQGGMAQLNKGKIPAYNQGGFAGGFQDSLGSGLGAMGTGWLMQKMQKKAESDKPWQRPDDAFQKNRAWKRNNMSAHFMQNSSDVKNEASMARQALQAKEQEWIDKQNKKQALGRQVVSLIGNAAMSGLGNELSSGTGWGSKEGVSAFGRADNALGYKKAGLKMQKWGLDKQGYGPGSEAALRPMDDGDYENFDQYNKVSEQLENSPKSMWQKGYSWNKNYTGGKITGPAGIDKVPAMLTEGEYVINANAARKIGIPSLEKINSGKFNEGGLVGDTTKPGESSSAGGMTNNISINVNVEGGNAKDGSKSSDTAADSKSNMDNLTKKIKQQVVMVIKQENRPGGLLG
jgi:TP901 family phage tail tape measure protein